MKWKWRKRSNVHPYWRSRIYWIHTTVNHNTIPPRAQITLRPFNGRPISSPDHPGDGLIFYATLGDVEELIHELKQVQNEMEKHRR